MRRNFLYEEKWNGADSNRKEGNWKRIEEIGSEAMRAGIEQKGTVLS
jgi:hypothetical protein